jgi:hypothetical protein
MHLAGGVTGCALLDDDATDLLLPCPVLSGHRLNGHPGGHGIGGIGDEYLAAIDDPLALFEPRVGLAVARVAACLGFSQAEAPELLPAA